MRHMEEFNMKCEYCEHEVKYSHFLNWENEIELNTTGASLGIDNIGVYICGYEVTNKWYINYCPVCGRQVRKPRKYNIKETMENIPVELYLYDLLYYKEPLIDNPIKTRRETLESIVNTTDMIHLSKLVLCGPENIDDAKELFEESIKGGHEGIMIKNAYEPYIPGIRGKKMLKYKAEPENLDVVVVGGTKGIGKRGEFIGSYLIALQDEDENLKPIAQVGTGLSD